MTLTLFGIPNCDTVKKARAWLDGQGRSYVFHDYKKQGADREVLARWSDAVGWERLLNRAGTTFRKLSNSDKAGLAGPDARPHALDLMVASPSMIRRPVVEGDGLLLVGFDATDWRVRLAT